MRLGRRLGLAVLLIGVLAGPGRTAEAATPVGSLCATAGGCWSRMDMPAEPAYLGPMSCPSDTFCMAVGASAGVYPQPSASEVWNGSTWSWVPTADPALPTSLGGVSCTSPTFCIAVGGTYLDSQDQPVAERWDGTSWSTMPAITGVSDGYFDAVSCTSATFCIAVGNDFGEPLVVQRWDGTSWSPMAMSLPADAGVIADSPVLYGVSCLSPSFCMAVGQYGVQPWGDAPLAETFDGSTWSPSTTIHPTVEYTSALYGVTCLSTESCVAVGFFNSNPDPGTMQQYSPLGEQWDGSAWTIMTMPSVASDARLTGISCLGPTWCIAVGVARVMSTTGLFVLGPYQPLAMQWNGTAWAPMVVDDSGTETALGAVFCLPSMVCMAGGDTTTEAPLVERYVPALPAP